MKKFFNNVKSHRKNDKKAKATQQGSGGSFSDISVSSEPIQGTQANQENQTPGISIQSAVGVQSSAMPPKETHTLHIAGSILEQGLKTLKGFAGFVPVPGLGPALDIVCGCIDVYHVSELLITAYREQVTHRCNSKYRVIRTRLINC